MARALAKGLVVAAAAAATSLLVSLEAFAFSLVVFDREAGCRAADELCDLNAVAAAVTGAGFGLAAFIGTAIAGCLLAVGSTTGAKIAAGATFALLFVGHVSLLA
jgi:hypothetical protein